MSKDTNDWKDDTRPRVRKAKPFKGPDVIVTDEDLKFKNFLKMLFHLNKD